MRGGVHERPDLSGCFCIGHLAAKQPSPNAEQNPSPQLQRLRLRIGPRKRMKQRQPCVFQRRKLLARHSARQELGRDRLQARFRWNPALIEFLKPLAPPGHADCAKVRISTGRNDVGKCQVQVPERGEGRPQLARQLIERDLAITVEPALSDR